MYVASFLPQLHLPLVLAPSTASALRLHFSMSSDICVHVHDTTQLLAAVSGNNFHNMHSQYALQHSGDAAAACLGRGLGRSSVGPDGITPRARNPPGPRGPRLEPAEGASR